MSICVRVTVRFRFKVRDIVRWLFWLCLALGLRLALEVGLELWLGIGLGLLLGFGLELWLT